jgi:hypothetical protein
VTTGYSGTPLAKKLGIREGTVVQVINPPPNYAALVKPLPSGAAIRRSVSRAPSFVHVFCTKRAELAKHLKQLRKRITQDGTLWISWPKKASKVATDITEDAIRAECLPLGFVDIKVCAVDETWSGLKLVIRVSERQSPRA